MCDVWDCRLGVAGFSGSICGDGIAVVVEPAVLIDALALEFDHMPETVPFNDNEINFEPCVVEDVLFSHHLNTWVVLEP